MAWWNPWRKTGEKAQGNDALPISPPLGTTGGYGQGRLRSMLATLLPGTRYNYIAEAGELDLNSIVAACLRFYVLNCPQARPRVARAKPEGGTEEIADHDIVRILMRPDPGMSRAEYIEQLLMDYWVHGNAYEYKRRGASGFGRVQALQWLPADMVEPRTDATFGVVYDYRVQGRLVKTIPAIDMIHHRMGRDPDNLLKGRSYLIAVLREIAADNSHSTAAGAMSRNMGISSWLIGSKGTDKPNSPYEAPTQNEVDVVASRVTELTTKDETGKAVGITGDYTATRLSLSPEELDLSAARQTPEERVCAVFGISPIVVHLGAGLARSTFANYKEARQGAWEDGILPLLDLFAAKYTQELLEDHPSYQEGDEITFETSRVRALQDDKSANIKDSAIAYNSGMWDRATAKRHSGKLADKSDEGLYKGTQAPQPLPPPLPAPTPPTKHLPIKNADAVLAEARRARNEMLGLEASVQASVVDVFASVQSDLAAIVDALEAELLALEQAGDMITPARIAMLDRYQQLLQQADVEVSALAQNAATLTEASQAEAAVAGGAGAEALTGAVASSAGVAVTWNALPVATLRALAGGLADGTPLLDHFGTLGPDLRDALAKSIAKGQGAKETARALRGALSIGMKRAETIARTETIRAYREASRLSYAANSSVVKGYQRLSAADSKTCAACWALHCSEHATSEIMPSHCNCRCVMVPTVAGGPALPDRDTAFEAMSETDQRTVLGVQGFDLWKAGTPLSAFAVVSDGRFGPTARVANLSELGGSTS